MPLSFFSLFYLELWICSLRPNIRFVARGTSKDHTWKLIARELSPRVQNYCVISQNVLLSRLRSIELTHIHKIEHDTCILVLPLWCNLHSQSPVHLHFFSWLFFFPSDPTLFALALFTIIIIYTWFSILICLALFLFDLGVCYRPNYLLCKDEDRCFITCQVVLKTSSYLTYLMIWKVFNQFGHLFLLLLKKNIYILYFF